MSHYPERIANLKAQLDAKDAELQAERNRTRVTQTMLESSSSSRIAALNAAYGPYKDTNVGIVLKLLHTLQEAHDACDPLRGAPLSDTSRVGHPELTATEAAVMTYRRQRATVRTAGRKLEGFIDWLEGEMTGETVKVPGWRCHKASCKGKRWPAEQRCCGNCGRKRDDEEEAA
jgi:hypothetical protein